MKYVSEETDEINKKVAALIAQSILPGKH